MKELYLIPKLTYERLMGSCSAANGKSSGGGNPPSSTLPRSPRAPETGSYVKVPLKINSRGDRRDVTEQYKTHVKPPKMGGEGRNKDGISLNVTPSKSISKNHQPSLSHVIPIHFSETKFPYVNSVLEYLKTSGNVMWNEQGDLNAPLSGYNILSIIRDFSDRVKVDEATARDYKYVIDAAGIPNWLIRNKSLVYQLNSQPKIKKGGGRIGVRGSSSWKPY